MHTTRILAAALAAVLSFTSLSRAAGAGSEQQAPAAERELRFLASLQGAGEYVVGPASFNLGGAVGVDWRAFSSFFSFGLLFARTESDTRSYFDFGPRVGMMFSLGDRFTFLPYVALLFETLSYEGTAPGPGLPPPTITTTYVNGGAGAALAFRVVAFLALYADVRVVYHAKSGDTLSVQPGLGLAIYL